MSATTGGAAGHRYEIREPDGKLAAVHVRRDLPDGTKSFHWEGPDGQRNLGGRRAATLPLYGTERLPSLPESTVIMLCEGEKAAGAVNGLGLAGVFALGTVTGAGTAPEAGVLEPLARFARVVLWPDHDQPGEEHMARIATRLPGEGVREIRRLAWPDARDHGDAADFVSRGGDAAGLRELVDAAKTWPAAESLTHQESPRPDPASQIVELARSARVEVFIWEGQPYFSAPVDRHVETYPLGTKSAAARQYLLRLYREHRGRLPGKDALSGALEAFAADARFGGEFPVALRVGQLDTGDIAIDRGGPDYTAYVVGPGGWTEAPHPARFRRPRTIRALPSPVPGGSIDELRGFLNLRENADWYLVLAWLVAALRPVGPYPVLVLHGEAGTAKSTIAVVLRALVDPSVAPLRSLPKDPRDLAVAAQANWCLAFNNVSTILVEVSDALCQLSTGGGFATRQMYTDDEEVVLFGQRPVIINSVEEVVVRGDLLDRSLLIELHAIPEARRRAEREFWAAFDEARPRILGALLDLLAGAMRELPEVTPAELPRMADFAQVGVALEWASGWPEGSFLEAYRGSALEAAETALGGSPIVPILVELAHGSGEAMTAGELLEELDRRSGRPAEELRRLRAWPHSARALAGQFARLAPDLRRAHGVVVERLEPRTSRGHLWQITAGTGDLTVTTVTTAISSSNPGADRLPAGDGSDGPQARPAPGGHGAVTLPSDGSDGRVTVGDPPTVTPVSPSFELGEATPGSGGDGGDGLIPSLGGKKEERENRAESVTLGSPALRELAEPVPLPEDPDVQGAAPPWPAPELEERP